MRPKDVDGVVISVDPDQPAPVGAILSAFIAQTCLSQSLEILRYMNQLNDNGLKYKMHIITPVSFVITLTGKKLSGSQYLNHGLSMSSYSCIDVATNKK